MKTLLPAALLIGSIQSAMHQPIFPGKIVIWLLFMLSIVSWVMIISKTLQLNRIRKADRRFGLRLRKSRTTLEVFEEGWHDENSLQLIIYSAGARETAFQLLGTRNPSDGMQEQIQDAGKLSSRQQDFLQGAFQAGYRHAQMRLSNGVAGLRFIGISAILLGLIGTVWTLMSGFDVLEEGSNLGPLVGSALGFMALALLVATPAILGRIAFSIHIEKRRFETRKFRDDISRLFERKFSTTETVPYTAASVDSSDGGEEEMDSYPPSRKERREPEEEESVGSGGKKQYHSIREKLMRPSSDKDGDNELSMNPIARQAATLKAKI